MPQSRKLEVSLRGDATKASVSFLIAELRARARQSSPYDADLFNRAADALLARLDAAKR